MFFYRVAEPNEALIISGLRAHHGPEGDAAGLGLKIVVGKGARVLSGLKKVRRLSLDIHESELDLDCVTTQGIRVVVKAVVTRSQTTSSRSRTRRAGSSTRRTRWTSRCIASSRGTCAR